MSGDRQGEAFAEAQPGRVLSSENTFLRWLTLSLCGEGKRGDASPETFDFLGFTHICGKTRQGRFAIKRISAAKKLRNKLRELTEKLRRKMHQDMAQVGTWLSSVYRGWCNYHAIPGNWIRLRQFRSAIQKIWLRVLRRRSQRGRRLDWKKFGQLSVRWLPAPKILHPYPSKRFERQHPR